MPSHSLFPQSFKRHSWPGLSVTASTELPLLIEMVHWLADVAAWILDKHRCFVISPDLKRPSFFSSDVIKSQIQKEEK